MHNVSDLYNLYCMVMAWFLTMMHAISDGSTIILVNYDVHNYIMSIHT